MGGEGGESEEMMKKIEGGILLRERVAVESGRDSSPNSLSFPEGESNGKCAATQRNNLGSKRGNKKFLFNYFLCKRTRIVVLFCCYSFNITTSFRITLSVMMGVVIESVTLCVYIYS